MEITRTPNTNGTVDTCTLDDGYGYQCETHDFTRRGIRFQVVISDTEDGTHLWVAADGPGINFHDHSSWTETRAAKAEARQIIEDIAYPELNTRPRYGTPEWERDAEAFELAQAEAEYLGR
jgi:hypothetical protein